MGTQTTKGKEIKLPGPDHPITITAFIGTVRISVAGTVIANSSRALCLEEKDYPSVYYIPRNDAEMSHFVQTTHYSYCPYKGDCTYFSIPLGGSKSEFAVWTYEHPYEAVAVIKDHLAFYPTRVDEIAVVADTSARQQQSCTVRHTT